MQREIRLPENPSADKVYKFLEKVTSNLDFRNPFDILKYYVILVKYFPKFNSPNQKVHSETKNVFRVRKNDSPGALFSNLGSMMYPPKEKVWVSRANVPGEPVFYCSDNAGTGIYEVRPKVGDWITIIDIELQIPMLDLLALGLDKNVKIVGPLDEVDKGIHRFLEKHFKKMVPSDKPHLYYHTAVFVRSFLGDKHGVRYPSVCSSLNGVNIALKREFFDTVDKQFRSAKVQEVISIKSKYKIGVRCLYSADTVNKHGDFIWKKVTDCEGHLISKEIYSHSQLG